MKVIVAGSRSITRYSMVVSTIEESKFDITELLSGDAFGVDRLAQTWANSKNIPIRMYIPDWKKHGKRAGPIRNGKMAKDADALIACWDGKSRGTADMIQQAKESNLEIFIKIIEVLEDV